MPAVLGGRRACLARELTKMYEEFIRGSLSVILQECHKRRLKGEFVLVVQGESSERRQLSEQEMQIRLRELLDAGGRLKDVSSLLAAESGWPASKIYKLALSSSEGEEDNRDPVR